MAAKKVSASLLSAQAKWLSLTGVPAAFTAPGTSGNVLTSDGTAWLSSAPSGGSSSGDSDQIVLATQVFG